ncbi:unnamed protein product [Amoebophrya sp. A25]|nr:unnamed protein product [Amoebophrya sp. A25]|eukprot:GSA25T00006490001.1
MDWAGDKINDARISDLNEEIDPLMGSGLVPAYNPIVAWTTSTLLAWTSRSLAFLPRIVVVHQGREKQVIKQQIIIG